MESQTTVEKEANPPNRGFLKENIMRGSFYVPNRCLLKDTFIHGSCYGPKKQFWTWESEKFQDSYKQTKLTHTTDTGEVVDLKELNGTEKVIVRTALFNFVFPVNGLTSCKLPVEERRKGDKAACLAEQRRYIRHRAQLRDLCKHYEGAIKRVAVFREDQGVRSLLRELLQLEDHLKELTHELNAADDKIEAATMGKWAHGIWKTDITKRRLAEPGF
ncbi:MAG: hypothetical protein Q9218_003975 [Villophora microphyllina]